MSSVPNKWSTGQPEVRQRGSAGSRPPSQVGKTELVRLALHEHLRKTATFIKVLDTLVQVFGWVSGLLVLLILACAVDHWVWPLPTAGRWFFWLAGTCGTIWWVTAYLFPLLARKINLTYAAKRIEHLVPEFKNGLISWLELEAIKENGVPRGVMAALAYRAKKFIGGQDPSATVDTSQLIKLVGCVLLLMTTLVVYMMVSPKSVIVTGKRVLMPWATLAAPTRVQLLSILPGGTELTQGKPLEVDVELRGLHRDEPVLVRFSSTDGQLVDQRVALESLTDGFHYAGYVTTSGDGIEQEIDYFVEAGDAVAGPFRVTLNPLPSVVLESVELQFPEYTRLAPRIVSTGAVEAVEGSRATIIAKANQTMRRGWLEIAPELDERGELQRARALVEMKVAGRELTGELLLQLDENQTNPTEVDYRIRGYNERSDSNPRPILHRFSVLADVGPEVTLIGPESRILRVQPTSKVNLEIRASDPDYGLSKLVLNVQKRGGQREVVLLEDAGLIGRQVRTYQLDLARQGVAVGEQIKIRAIAYDNRHDPLKGTLASNESASEPLTLEVVGADQPTDVVPANEPSDPPSEAAAQRGANENSQNNKQGSGQTESRNSGATGDAGSSSDNSESNDRQNSGQVDPSQNEDGSGQQSSGAAGSAGQDQAGQSSDQGADSSGGAATGQANEGAAGQGKQSGQGGSGQSQASDKNSGSGSGSGQGSGKGSQSAESRSQSGQSAGARQSDPGAASNATGAGDARGSDGAGGEPNASSGGGQGSGDASRDREVIERVQEFMESSQQSGDSQRSNNAQQGANTNAATQDANAEGGAQAGEQPRPAEGAAENSNSKSQSAGNGAGEGNSGEAESPNEGGSGAGKQDSAEGQPAGSQAGGGNSESQSGQPQPGGQNEQGSLQKNGDQASDAQPTGGQEQGGGSQGSNTQSQGDQSEGNRSSGQGGQSGDESAAGSSSDSSQANQQQSGDSSAGQSQPGQSQSGKSGAESEQSGGGQSGSQQAAGQNPSGQSSENQSSENQSSGNQSSGNQSSGNQSSGSQSSGSQSSGSQQSGGGQQSNAGPSSSSPSGQSSGAEQQQQTGGQGQDGGDSKTGNSESGGKDGGTQSSGQSSGQTGEGAQAGSPQQQAGSGQSGSQAAAGQSGKSPSGQSGSSTGGDQAGGRPSSGGGTGASGGEGGGTGESDALNQDYASRTTQMVLDYLNRQKDQPDPELLRELNWSQEDLSNFVTRWNRARDLATNGSEEDRLRWDAQLRDLGLRSNDGGPRQGPEYNDSFQQMQDGGTRVRPPEGLRKQWEAFRRAIENRRS